MNITRNLLSLDLSEMGNLTGSAACRFGVRNDRMVCVRDEFHIRRKAHRDKNIMHEDDSWIA